MNEQMPQYKSFGEFAKKEIEPKMEELDREKIKKAENELAEFQQKYQKYADSAVSGERQYYERGIKLRQEDLAFLRKYFDKGSGEQNT